jgi:hypothetical protein
MADQTGGLKLHTLIPPADFKAILSIDDREEALARYYLIAATYSIDNIASGGSYGRNTIYYCPSRGTISSPSGNTRCGRFWRFSKQNLSRLPFF